MNEDAVNVDALGSSQAPLRLCGDRAQCVGAGMCVLTAPDLFEQDDEQGLVVVLKDVVDVSAVAAAQAAVDACPSGALSLQVSEAADTGE